MDVNDIRDIDIVIARYLAGEATPAETARLLQWIDSCEANRRSFFEQKDIWNAIAPAFSPDDIDTGEAERRVALLTAPGQGAARRRDYDRLWRLWGRVAAVLALPVVAALVYLMVQRPAAQQSHDITLSTAYGYTMETVLPDSSRVWLNANSRLTYPSRFLADGSREVRLCGEAYFEVRSDREHPFRVRSGAVTVTATGTQFNVNSYPRSKSVSVTLVDGSVSVTSPADTVRMQPGEHLLLKGGTASLCHDADISKFCSWRKGILLFDDRLCDICARLEQIYNVEFRVDSAVAHADYHMVLKGETIGEVMNLLQLSAPVACTALEPDSCAGAGHPRQTIRITAR